MKRRGSKDWFTAYCQSGPPVVSDIAPMLRVINKFNLYDKLYTCRREYSSKVICDIDDDDDDDDDNDRQVIMNVSRMSKTRTLDETTCSQSSFPASAMIRRCCARQKIVEFESKCSPVCYDRNKTFTSPRDQRKLCFI